MMYAIIQQRWYRMPPKAYYAELLFFRFLAVLSGLFHQMTKLSLFFEPSAIQGFNHL